MSPRAPDCHAACCSRGAGDSAKLGEKPTCAVSHQALVSRVLEPRPLDAAASKLATGQLEAAIPKRAARPLAAVTSKRAMGQLRKTIRKLLA
jgi:hypothetical protein